jgi:PAS domain S-box-containing protein
MLANQAAIAVENARLVEGLEAEVASRTAAIVAEQERSETILRSVGDAIATFDLELRIDYVNDAFMALTGYTVEEISEQPIHILAGERLSEYQWNGMRKSLAEGQVWQGELIGRRKDGRTYDAALTIAPLYDTEGILIGYVSSHRDISRLKELDRARSRFMTNVSHEFRTPVTNLKLYTHLLHKDQTLERNQDYLNALRRQVDQLEHLVNDVLAMTELDAGEAIMAWEPVSLATPIWDAVTRFESQAQASGIHLVVRPIPTDLSIVNGDAARLTQALSELVENAITFTPAGGEVVVEVEGAEEQGRQWVTIAVRDTGPGILIEEQERVFDRFYRGNLAESGHVAGTGLGLSMVQAILNGHAGQVTINSKVGQGSTFTLWLPVAE